METDGVEYHFTDRSAMEAMIEDDEFIETAEFAGNLYGTSKQAVKDIQNKGGDAMHGGWERIVLALESSSGTSS